MKYNTVYLLLVLLSLLSVVFCLNQNDKIDFEDCKKACDEDLLPRLDSMVRNNSRIPEDFENLNMFWLNCQVKCSRCNLHRGARTMNSMRDIFRNNLYSGSSGLAALASQMNALAHSLKWNCYAPWENALKIDDLTSKF